MQSTMLEDEADLISDNVAEVVLMLNDAMLQVRRDEGLPLLTLYGAMQSFLAIGMANMMGGAIAAEELRLIADRIEGISRCDDESLAAMTTHGTA